MQQLVKVVLPWLLLLFWLVHAGSLRHFRAAAAALYLTVFAGFASNFTPFYREVGQFAAIVVGIYVLLEIYHRRRILRINNLFGAFALFALVSLASNQVTSLALAALLNLVSVILAVNFLCLRLELPDALAAFMRYYVRLSLLLATFSVIEWTTFGGRAEVTFSNTNYLGFFLGPAACAALCFPGIRGRWTSWLIISLGIYSTGSRAAMMFPLFAAIAFFSFGGARRVVYASPLLVLFSIVALVVPQPASLTGRTSLEGSDLERYTAIEVGWEMIRENPVVGVGWGRFQEEFWTYLGQAESLLPGTSAIDINSQRDVVSHNDLVRVFAEMGIPAGFFFCWLIVFAIYAAWRFAGEYKPFVLAVLGGSLVFSLTHNNLNSSLFWYLFLLPIGLYYRHRIIRPALTRPLFA